MSYSLRRMCAGQGVSSPNERRSEVKLSSCTSVHPSVFAVPPDRAVKVRSRTY